MKWTGEVGGEGQGEARSGWGDCGRWARSASSRLATG